MSIWVIARFQTDALTSTSGNDTDWIIDEMIKMIKQAAKAVAIVGALGTATMGAAHAGEWVNPDAPKQTGNWQTSKNTTGPQHIEHDSYCSITDDGKTIDCYMSDGGQISISAVDRDGKKLSKRDIQQRLKAEYSLYVMKKNNYAIDEPSYNYEIPKAKPEPKYLEPIR